MKKLDEETVTGMYLVLVEGETLQEARPDLFTAEDDDPLEIIDPDYINKITIENGERVIYWEENYIAHYYRMGENDGDMEKEIIEALYNYGLWEDKE